MVIEAIAERGILLNFPHPNQERYPDQKVLVVELNGYAYCVPYVINGIYGFLRQFTQADDSRICWKGDNNGPV
jgi:hypothetical protein